MKSIILLFLCLLAAPLFAKFYPPTFKDARVETYRTIGSTELKLWIFGESDPKAKKPAIVFFFGGGWHGGTPAQFEDQARYFAKRGMIAITADYRVKSRQGVQVVECVKDAKAAIAWVRQNAQRRGIDPDKIAVLGGSRLTNEDAYAWSKLARTVLGTDHVDAQLGDGLPAEVVLGLPRATIDDACSADLLVLLSGDLKEELPVLYLRVRGAVVDHGAADPQV
ncbi:MAG: alpha/beta hydrolase fold domain-containing protein, partial [Verrucomicrobiaceae bacterium]